MIKIKEFYIEESKENKGRQILIAVDEHGDKWVVSGDIYSCPYIMPYNLAFDTREPKSKKGGGE